MLPCAGEVSGLELCTSVLELLQWKDDIHEEAELLGPLTKVLQQLLASSTQAASMLTAASPAGMDTSDDEPSDEQDDDAELQILPR